MLANRKLILDTFCEVAKELTPIADDLFSNLIDHAICPGAIYVVSREMFSENYTLFTELAKNNTIQLILCNAWEGSNTLLNYLDKFKIQDLVLENKIWVVAGGHIEGKYPHIVYEYFITQVLTENNILEIDIAGGIFTKVDKPYKFLFLNGRTRANRKYLLQLFEYTGLLKQSLWTNLDDAKSTCHPLYHGNFPAHIPTSLPFRQLPAQYEVDRYVGQLGIVCKDTSRPLYLKYHMFNNEWGDIHIKAAPYIDTYFSLVTETVFDNLYSFRTEKLWKPVAVGHPFIVSANAGYYRDLHKLGFKTFGHLIDESFDTMANHQDRMNGLAAAVEDLCRQDLPAFLAAAEETCKYNQHHLAEISSTVQREFPPRFENFVNERFRI